MTLVPRNVTPNLNLPLVAGRRFDLSEDHGKNGTMLVFYRGLHCPICVKQLKELATKMPEFDDRGIAVVAVSSDTEDRAARMSEQIGGTVPVAYDFPLSSARDDWGLYISTSRGKTSIGIEEPEFFHEPGLLLVKPDRALYYLSVQSMPFARPSFDDILGAIDFATEKNYPARGHYTGAL